MGRKERQFLLKEKNIHSAQNSMHMLHEVFLHLHASYDKSSLQTPQK
jgi:hypothetical protein